MRRVGGQARAPAVTAQEEAVGAILARARASGRRQDRIDMAVRDVMALGRIRQGYAGMIEVNRAAVRAWWEQGGPLNAWWWAFTSAVQAQYRRIPA